MQRRLDEMPDAVRVRRSVVEHAFGTIKDRMGRDHFRTRRLANVGTEMSLHVLAYNSANFPHRRQGRLGGNGRRKARSSALDQIVVCRDQGAAVCRNPHKSAPG